MKPAKEAVTRRATLTPLCPFYFDPGSGVYLAIVDRRRPRSRNVDTLHMPRGSTSCNRYTHWRGLSGAVRLTMARRIPPKPTENDIEERQIFLRLMALQPGQYAEARELLTNAPPSPVMGKVAKALDAYWEALGELDEYARSLENT